MILVFFLFAIRYQEPWQVTVLCVYSVALITCSMTDVIAHRIPDLVTYPAAGLSLIVMSSVPNTQLYDLISGAALFSGVLLVFYLLPGAGLGDAKLGVSAGLVLGLQSAYAALLVMAISGGIFAFAYLAATRFRTWKKAIPYGPHIAMGTIAVALANGVAFRTF
jgi:prepilin signal peptidase PulO-like enzyme (type II secretory pathway)